MSDVTENQLDAPLTQYDELPDAPPKRRMKFSLIGKIAISIVSFWVVVAFVGPFVSPYHEADIIADDSFTEMGEVCSERNLVATTRARGFIFSRRFRRRSCRIR